MTEKVENIYIICPVRNADPAITADIAKYVDDQEALGHHVHFPPRDVDQSDPIGIDICTSHLAAMKNASRVDIFWDVNSKGSHFDLGMAFALGKRINLIKVFGEVPSGKSYVAVMREIQRRQSP